MLHFSIYTEKNWNDSLIFSLAVATAAVQFGLTSYLVGSRMRGTSYNTLSIIFLFDALWTFLYPSACVLWYTKGDLDLLAYLIDSMFWIFATAMFWGLGVGFAHNTRARKSCGDVPFDIYCPHYVSPVSLAWMEFVLCVSTLILAIMWVRASQTRRVKRQRFYV